MTHDDIIRMTIEASATGCADELTGDAIERFAKLVAAKEREACARFLETTDICGDAVMDELASAIRARGE